MEIVVWLVLIVFFVLASFSGHFTTYVEIIIIVSIALVSSGIASYVEIVFLAARLTKLHEAVV